MRALLHKRIDIRMFKHVTLLKCFLLAAPLKAYFHACIDLYTCIHIQVLTCVYIYIYTYIYIYGHLIYFFLQ